MLPFPNFRLALLTWRAAHWAKVVGSAHAAWPVSAVAHDQLAPASSFQAIEPQGPRHPPKISAVAQHRSQKPLLEILSNVVQDSTSPNLPSTLWMPPPIHPKKNSISCWVNGTRILFWPFFCVGENWLPKAAAVMWCIFTYLFPVHKYARLGLLPS